MDADYNPARIGPGLWVRRMRTQITLFTTPTSGAMLVDANANRYWISISSTTSSAIVVKPQSAVISGEGYNLPVGGADVRFSFDRDGEVVMEQWWVGNFGGGGTVMVVEGLWNPGVE